MASFFGSYLNSPAPRHAAAHFQSVHGDLQFGLLNFMRKRTRATDRGSEAGLYVRISVDRPTLLVDEIKGQGPVRSPFKVFEIRINLPDGRLSFAKQWERI